MASNGEWNLGQLHAIQWLGAAASWENGGEQLEQLLELVVAEDAFTSEMAFATYRRIGAVEDRDQELGAALPASKLYLFDLNFLPSSYPQ